MTSNRMLRGIAVVFTVVGMSVGLASTAEAGFIGSQLDASYRFPDVATAYANASFAPAAFIVGAGQETAGDVEGVTTLLVDFTDTSLTIVLDTVLANPTWNASAFNGVLFTLLSAGALDIAGASVNAATTMAGFDASRVTFDAGTIGINWNGLSYVDGTTVVVDFTFARPVPEPSTLLLIAAGLLLLGLATGMRTAARRGLASSASALS